jgi:hypothetical protein
MLDALKISDAAMIATACNMAEKAGIDQSIVTFAQLEAQRLSSREAECSSKAPTIYQRLRWLEEQGRLKVSEEGNVLSPECCISHAPLQGGIVKPESKDKVSSEESEAFLPKALPRPPLQRLADEPTTPRAVCKILASTDSTCQHGHSDSKPSVMRGASPGPRVLNSPAKVTMPESMRRRGLASEKQQVQLEVSCKSKADESEPSPQKKIQGTGEGEKNQLIQEASRDGAQDKWLSWLPDLGCANRDKEMVPHRTTCPRDREKEPNYL